MKFNKFSLVSLLVMLLLVLQGCSSGTSAKSGSKDGAGNYPERDIEIVVGWGAGGGTDTFARSIAKEMSEILGVNINVVNLPGASGANAGDHTARQPADGYTIWAISSNYPINVARNTTPHDLSKYKAIGRVQQDTMSLQVLKGKKFTDYEDFVKQAKDNPGKISVGGTGAVGFDELVLRQFEEKAGIKLNYISYEDAGEMHAALLGGHIDSMLEEIGPSIAQIDEKSVEMLLAFTDKKLEGFDETPISTEKGIDLIDGQERGLLVHSDTPDEVVEVLQNALEKAKDSEDYKKYEKDSYLHLRDGWLNGEEFKKNLEKNIQTYQTIVEGLQ
ncbi:tripartite tricarboxylate transporter substrate binding protein [Cytobacillus oceanisediminis]|jgi:putative tricarboxylic transport membrane protein|uniref:tripartite tricarboxylate transporter substrate binding protein n=1 Tax=Cytobacillus oceanisediminis TaxID=665099 RepID=UPI0023D9B867|nr:tripartite tricarboxylate transporter substrate binding protein [Cytobacillus oceanisediminis]MDF2035840.1 tripartite tricarboxylate transporter substrate binding protein [Cytobacillus oceanisediminis]